MTYVVLLSEAAKAELVVIKKRGDKSTLKKIANLLVELQEHPRIGTGQGWLIKGRTSNGAHILGCNPVIL